MVSHPGRESRNAARLGRPVIVLFVGAEWISQRPYTTLRDFGAGIPRVSPGATFTSPLRGVAERIRPGPR
jgi:hypothetical protein